MNIKEATATIIEIFKGEKDELLRLLKIFELTQKEDLNKIIDIYLKIKNKDISIVRITSSIELDQKQKQTLEEKVKNQFKEDLIFNYKIKKTLQGGIEVYIGDTLLNLDLNWY